MYEFTKTVYGVRDTFNVKNCSILQSLLDAIPLLATTMTTNRSIPLKMRGLDVWILIQ